jgi:hypothetical protein
MSNRQEHWRKLGYTDEQIRGHLDFECYKSKLSRERKKKNNLENQKLIEQIKADLVGKTFQNKFKSIKVLSIRPSVDGVGFWCKIWKRFSDGSEGKFREFQHFSEYNKKELIEQLYL